MVKYLNYIKKMITKGVGRPASHRDTVQEVKR